MPFDNLSEREALQQRNSQLPVGLRGQAASALRAVLGDIAYFWWAFVALGTVMLASGVC